MKTLATCLIALCLWCGAASSLHAQAAAPAPAPAPASAPAPAPAAAPAPAPAEAAPATPAPAAAPEAAPAAPAEAAPPALPAATEPLSDPAQSEHERQVRESERARIRLLLARARSERAARDAAAGNAQGPAPQPEPVRHGDAGAALALGLSIEVPWHTEAEYDLFSSTDVDPRYGLWATYDLLAFGERTFLAAGAGFDIENVNSNNLFGGLDTELTAVVLYGTATVRHVVADWLQPHARLSLGGQLVRSRLSFGDNAYDNDADLPFGSLSAGFTLRTPTRFFESRRGDMAALSFGIMVEGGYTLAGSLDMKVDGRGPDERDIALTESDLEDLDRSGPLMRISFVGRFY